MTLAPADAAKHTGGFVRAVAIGVGASGLGALESLFGALRQGSDLAFIVVQHGSPSALDALTDRIATLTNMRVSRLQYGAQLAANEVRVAPPGYAVELHNGRLQLELPPEPSERRTIVDRLFRSLARSLGTRAIGVVLPGTGSDGALGARAIAREGGAVFAAREDSSRDSLRDRSADSEDPHVFGPEEIAHLLQEPSALGAYAAGLPKSSRAPASSQSQAARLSAEKMALQERFDVVRHENEELARRLNIFEQRLSAAQAREAVWRNAQVHQSKLLGDAAIGVVMLDGQLRVESFSGDVSGIYTLSKADIGQPLEARAHHAQEMPPLPPLDSLRAGVAVEHPVITHQRYYLRRILPRHDAAGRVVIGMSLVFIDVTQHKRTGGAGSSTGRSSNVVTYVDETARTLPPRR
ncbi:MAG TPA: chemotaxis protein CheB [Polyangiales bacterium]|nr:chemotaxis protein CheB [Polyangiales bacterium]